MPRSVDIGDEQKCARDDQWQHESDRSEWRRIGVTITSTTKAATTALKTVWRDVPAAAQECVPRTSNGQMPIWTWGVHRAGHVNKELNYRKQPRGGVYWANPVRGLFASGEDNCERADG
jgi:hypothetical protein